MVREFQTVIVREARGKARKQVGERDKEMQQVAEMLELGWPGRRRVPSPRRRRADRR